MARFHRGGGECPSGLTPLNEMRTSMVLSRPGSSPSYDGEGVKDHTILPHMQLHQQVSNYSISVWTNDKFPYDY